VAEGDNMHFVREQEASERDQRRHGADWTTPSTPSHDASLQA
jgi:hypothetical protein